MAGIDWFRWHHGSVTDPKFQLIARKTASRTSDVLAVWACLLEEASQAETRGLVGQVDFESLDCLLGFDDGVTERIYSAMISRGLISSDGEVCSWSKRQPKREREDDSSTERSRRLRAGRQEGLDSANAAAKDAAAHDQQQRQPDTNTDTTNQVAPDSEEQSHATPRNATQRQKTPREEKSREDIDKGNKEGGTSRKRSATSLPERPGDVSEQVWGDWLKLRLDKKAAVTETVLDVAGREASKAGLSLEDFLRIWCFRGSQGLMADWLKPEDYSVLGVSRLPKRMQALAGANAAIFDASEVA